MADVKMYTRAPATETCSPTYGTVEGEWPTMEGVSTLWDAWCRSVKEYASNPCLGVRTGADGEGDYAFETYAEVNEKVLQFGSFLRKCGVSKHGRLGVYGANSPEWVTAMHGASSQSVYCVPLYDTLGADAVEYIVNHAECTAVAVQSAKAKAIFAALPKTPKVKTVIVWGGAAPEGGAPKGVNVVSYEEALEQGKAAPAEPVPPSADDLSTIMYTSGTTGDPKGVMLKHSSVVSACLGVLAHTRKCGITLDQRDSYLSYLPLAHIFDRVVEETFFLIGGKVGFWRGDVKMLVDDIGAFKPTLFAGVPRIFDRIYQGILSKVNEGSGLKRAIFNYGFKHKLKYLNAGYSADKASPLFDTLVFNKVKMRLGGNVRLIISGAAPLAKHCEDFLRVTMCAPAVQGYGLTETSAASFVAVPNKPGHVATVGLPQGSCEYRLESVPDMKYDALATPARGEVCIRGPGLFVGYYKQDALTEEAMDKDGFFHTGDIGEIQADGALKIIDRKKNIFKLAQGEYVAVEKVENVYGATAQVGALWVYGDSFQTYLVAVIVPNEKLTMEWAASAGVAGDFAAVCKTAECKKWMLECLEPAAKKGKLKGFEVVKKVHLDPEEFTVEKDLITPTFKKRRPQLKAYYEAAIKEMYGL